MQYPWIDEYCRSKNGCEKDYKAEWDATRYMLAGKMFALMGTDNMQRPHLSLKLEPSYGALLRQEHTDIIPGYYLNKLHWNSVLLEGNVPESLLKEMIDESYALILASLSKKLQKEITGS